MYIAQQVAFGPRVPGTVAHERCADFLQGELARHGANVRVQTGVLPNYAGEEQPIRNIIGSFYPEKKNRILLCAHYDSRPWADEEPNGTSSGIPAANDGASGVGVLLEIARQLGAQSTNKGVDIVFFDVEDMGTPSFYMGTQRENTWCLGSQLWANAHSSKLTTHDYQYGILLDMVGAPDAVFPKEYYSMQYARNYTEQIWRVAEQLGHTQYFRNELSHPIVDDHYYVNTIAGIPCVDIIHYNPNTDTGFAPWWHTENDDMSNISPATLQAVGEVVLTVIL